MTKIEVLKRCPYVRELDEEQLKKLADLGYSQVFEVGECLARQGRTGEKIFIIEDGLVGIYLELGPMTHRQLQAVSNFEVVGWSALIPPYRSFFTAKAIETTKVLAFDGKELLHLCDENPTIGNKVHRGLASLIAERLRHAYIQLMGVTSQEEV